MTTQAKTELFIEGSVSEIWRIFAHPPPELASELRWRGHPNQDTMSTFFFIGLLEDAGAFAPIQKCAVGNWIVRRKMAVRDGS